MSPDKEVARKEQKRLLQLQDDAKKGVGASGLSSITAPDLFLLLRKDVGLQAMIAHVVKEDIEKHQGIKPDTINRIETCEPDPLRQDLASHLSYLEVFRKDRELSSRWFADDEDGEGHQLLRLVACAAQWDLLCDLWDQLANRCKIERRAASEKEMLILESSLALHNLRWSGRAAMLIDVPFEAKYDYEKHQRGTSVGDVVKMTWLPGLKNAGGEVSRKPIVQT